MDESQHKAVHGPAIRFFVASILLVIPFFASPAMAQTCPRATDGFVLTGGIQYNNQLQCETEQNGSKRCSLRCEYHDPRDSFNRKFRFDAVWYSIARRAGTQPSWRAAGRCSNSPIASTLYINSEGRMAHAEIYPAISLSHPTSMNIAVQAARQLLSQVPAIPCEPQAQPSAKPRIMVPADSHVSPLGQGDGRGTQSTTITPIPPSGGVQGFPQPPFQGAAAPARDLPPPGAPTAPSQEARSSAVIPPQGGAERAPGPVGPRFQLQYQGRPFETQYQRQQHTDGTPIDIYFYEVRAPDGRQYVQDGSPLWGRFVRMPAAGHDAGSTAKWWHMEWVFRDGRWEQIHLENVPVEGLSPAR